MKDNWKSITTIDVTSSTENIIPTIPEGAKYNLLSETLCVSD